MKHTRLDRLEQRAAELLDVKSPVSVVFSDGTRRTMPLCDVINLLREDSGPQVVDVLGEEREGDGQLLALIRDIATIAATN